MLLSLSKPALIRHRYFYVVPVCSKFHITGMTRYCLDHLFGGGDQAEGKKIILLGSTTSH